MTKNRKLAEIQRLLKPAKVKKLKIYADKQLMYELPSMTDVEIHTTSEIAAKNLLQLIND